MAAYSELVDLIQQPLFRKRITYALWSCSVDVLNDVGASAGAKAFARKSLKGANADSDVITHLAVRCVSNPTIAAAGANCTDADIRFVVAGAFSEVAA